MASKTKKTEEPIAAATTSGSNTKKTLSTNGNTRKIGAQEKPPIIDIAETQNFQSDERQYVHATDSKSKGTHWLFVVYPESAPSNWVEQLEATGIPFTVSPLHDGDVNPTGEPKKAHYHVIVSYGQAQRYSSVIGLRNITHGPFPVKCGSVGGSYAYFTHKNNPEKAQYDAAEIRRFNGWERNLEANEVAVIKRKLTIFCLLEDVREYSELIAAVLEMDGDYLNVAMNNTVYFDRVVSSYRHSPIRTLKRFYGQLETDEERERIKSRIDTLEMNGGKFCD